MTYSTPIVYVGAADPVAEQVRTAVSQVQDCIFSRVDTVADAEEDLAGIGMVVAGYEAAHEPAFTSLLAESAAGERHVPVIVVGAPDEPSIRVEYIRRGAVDCLVGEIDVTRLTFLVDLLTVRFRCEGTLLDAGTPAAADKTHEEVDDFVFASSPMKEMLERLRAVASLDVTVLLVGETGTGKTHLARVLHRLSTRRNRPFTVLNCGAVTASLFESELFGHVRGAFTGADRDHKGRLAEAADGTILLDDIDCVPLELQSKLLHAIDDRVFEPVGSPRSQPFRARLIAATNRPLEQEVTAGRFRSDLYYRLNVIDFSLPPLRQRRDVLRPLIRRFLQEFARNDGRTAKKLSAAALAALESFDWPGNIRELRNVLRRAAAISRGGTIDVCDLPETVLRFREAPGTYEEPVLSGDARGAASGNDLAQARTEAEIERLIEVLDKHHNNRTSAAAELGVSRVTLYKKLHQYGLFQWLTTPPEELVSPD